MFVSTRAKDIQFFCKTGHQNNKKTVKSDTELPIFFHKLSDNDMQGNQFLLKQLWSVN